MLGLSNKTYFIYFVLFSVCFSMIMKNAFFPFEQGELLPLLAISIFNASFFAGISMKLKKLDE